MKWLRSRTAVVAVVGAVAVLTICLGAWQGWLAHAQTVRWVNAPPNPATEPTECATAYADIASAVAASVSGDTVRLCEGNYVGGVVVGKKITIEGRPGAAVSDIVVEVAAAGTNGITLQADEAAVRNLFLEGPGSDNGIAVDTVDNCTISGVEATDWGTGVVVGQSNGTRVEQSKLYENDTGIVLVDGGSNEVRGNEITHNTGGGLLISMEDQTLVEDNLISQNDLVQAEVVDVFLGPPGAPVHVRLANNDIVNKAGADAIIIDTTYGDSFVQISGSPASVNNFSGPYDIVAGHYYVDLDCGSESTVDATYNWWGSTDPTDIANRIFNDAQDPARGFTECPVAADQNRGGVVFDPWAPAAWTPTPTPTPTPSPTVTPTPSPSATPSATRTFDLVMGWNNFVWTGSSGTAAEAALDCIAGKFAVAYQWDGTSWKRHVPGRCGEAGMCTLATVNKYDSLLVLITASGVQCTMPVVSGS